MSKEKLSIVELLETCTAKVELSKGKVFEVRALTLEEMVRLMAMNQAVFFSLYASATKVKAGEGTFDLAPALLAAPDVVATIIALALDEEDVEAAAVSIRTKMPLSVQLIAVEAIWKLSVPDPKKTFALLSEAMGLLQKHLQKENQETPKENSVIS
jgi:hypothetical protein